MPTTGGPMPDTPSLKGEAESLLASMQLVPPREPGGQLRPIDEAQILELSAEGKSQVEIAEVVGCHQSTVSRTLAEWSDSRGLARRYAEAKSLEMMQRFVKDASPADILKMQQKLDVIREDKPAAGGGGVTVIVAVPGGSDNPRPVIHAMPPSP